MKPAVTSASSSARTASAEPMSMNKLDALPFTIRVSSDGSRAYVSNVMTGTVSVIDLTSYQVVARIASRYSGDLMAGTHGLCIVPAS